MPNRSLDLERFQRQYLQLVDPKNLYWPCKELLRDIESQTWLYNNLFNEIKQPYLPPDRYKMRILKQLMQLIENAIEDPDEDVCVPSQSSSSLP
jgi:protein-lysine N-methyltransferase EEF2KMT